MSSSPSGYLPTFRKKLHAPLGDQWISTSLQTHTTGKSFSLPFLENIKKIKRFLNWCLVNFFEFDVGLLWISSRKQIFKFCHIFERLIDYFTLIILSFILVARWAEIAESVLATGWTVQGSNSGRGDIFRTLLDRSWGLRSLPYNGTESFPAVKRSKLGASHSPHLALRIKKE
jgi:hypothetical protein